MPDRPSVYVETTVISYLTARPSRNATMRNRIADVCAASGFEAPVICTPEELLED